ncbi:MAG TPA: AbrB/MazE/SpoVT family DNA-binding domain-containing protein [Acetobacteraceae bacterium]|jgi:antitoxin MazE|nr:AbrB/MazE/SpoVT family DNA-binding domain-containing protein [Acetobacteraceae bacterium]
MQTRVRKLGNSAGLIIPKPLLAELGLAAGDAVECALEDGRLILTPFRQARWKGWAEASRRIADATDDAPPWPEFGNADDTALRW